MIRFWRLASPLLLLAPVGCAGISLRPIPSGVLATEGCVIEAEDGAFVIRSGRLFESPFQNMQFDRASGAREYDYRFKERLVSQFDVALDAGAHKVRVAVPGHDRKLYGVLFLGMGVEGCTDLAAKSYSIRIPEKYVKDALHGRLSVVYEEQSTGQQPASIPTWVLWMSDQPFY